MPADAEVMAVGAIDGEMYVWAITQAGPPTHRPRPIGYFATGDDVPDGWVYRGTALAMAGTFVWHVFEGV